jgi:single-strand DNA-binding protein
MSDINHVIIIGNLARDPELRTLPSGASVCSFNIANNFTYVKDGEKKSEASFFKCTAWGKTAEVVAQYVKKGHRLGVTGRLKQKTWEKDGEKKYDVEINVNEIQFLTPKTSEPEQKYMPEPDTGYHPPVSDDEIPF